MKIIPTAASVAPPTVSSECPKPRRRRAPPEHKPCGVAIDSEHDPLALSVTVEAINPRRTAGALGVFAEVLLRRKKELDFRATRALSVSNEGARAPRREP